MKTDKQLYLIFAANPEWIFELTGLESPGACEMQSVTLKEVEQDSDGVIVPRDATKPLTLVEFQFRRDETVYTRIVIEMAIVQRTNQMRAVRGMIFFRYPSHDPQTEPWKRVVEVFYLRDVLESLEKRDPNHPLVAVFRPVLLTNPQTLAAHARQYYHQIKAGELDEFVKQTLLDVFVNWLEQRLKDKGRKEIETMLLGELPDIRETRCGQDLMRCGKIEALLDQLEQKFGAVPPDLRQRIEALESDESDTLKRLMRQVLTIDSLDQLRF